MRACVRACVRERASERARACEGGGHRLLPSPEAGVERVVDVELLQIRVHSPQHLDTVHGSITVIFIVIVVVVVIIVFVIVIIGIIIIVARSESIALST